MSDFDDLRQSLTTRLDEGDRGDRGWFLTTRVHLSPSRLHGAAQYLRDVTRRGVISLSQRDYQSLAGVLGVDSRPPSLAINRHYLLAMDTPLQLVERIDGRRWSRIRLTPRGVALANTDDPLSLFERALTDFRFCRAPWYNATRVTEYSEFDVRPYPAILDIMRRSAGYVDVDEFDMFISRIRDEEEIDAAVEDIARFRCLAESDRVHLRQEVARRIPRGTGANPQKPYSNWRDMARHTFSLFALGTSAYRAGNELLLTRSLTLSVQTPTAPQSLAPTSAATQPPTGEISPRAPTMLQMPEAAISDDLRVPPAPSQANDGADAELLIGKMLAAAEWDVVYYNQRRGFGFDLWAKKGSQTYVIEVKSFVGQAGTVKLTRLEHQAALRHGANFLLIVVERCADENPTIHVVQDPANRIAFIEGSTAHHRASRAAWIAVALGQL